MLPLEIFINKAAPPVLLLKKRIVGSIGLSRRFISFRFDNCLFSNA